MDFLVDVNDTGEICLTGVNATNERSFTDVVDTVEAS
jgi:hypothetical protein